MKNSRKRKNCFLGWRFYINEKDFYYHQSQETLNNMMLQDTIAKNLLKTFGIIQLRENSDKDNEHAKNK